MKYKIYKLYIEVEIEDGEKKKYIIDADNREDRMNNGPLTESRIYGDAERENIINTSEIIEGFLNDRIAPKKEKLISRTVLSQFKSKDKELLEVELITIK